MALSSMCVRVRTCVHALIMEGLMKECHSSLTSEEIKARLCFGVATLLLPRRRLPDVT